MYIRFGKKSAPPISGEQILSKDSPEKVKEAYRNLRSAITLALGEEEGKVIAVTSVNRFEGKTLSAINLAVAFAQIGKKVLVVDGNLRDPRVHTALGENRSPGLTDLVENGAALASVILYNKERDIEVLPAGSECDDPTRIFQSGACSGLLHSLKDHYDYILIDYPADCVASDSLLRVKETDGYLLVVKAGETERRSVVKLIKNIENVRGNIIGFVYNMGVPEESRNPYDILY